MLIDERQDNLLDALGSYNQETRLLAFQQLIGCHFIGLQNKAQMITGTPMDAEDVTQNAYIRAYNHLANTPKIFATHDKFIGWVCTIMYNLHRDDCRKDKTADYGLPDNESLLDASAAHDIRNFHAPLGKRPVEELVHMLEDNQHADRMIAHGMATLQPREWTCVLLSLQGLSNQLIADLMNASKSTVQHWIANGFKRLRLYYEVSIPHQTNQWDTNLPLGFNDSIPGLTLFNTFPTKLTEDALQQLFTILEVNSIEQLHTHYFSMLTLYPINSCTPTFNLHFHRRYDVQADDLAQIKMVYVGCEIVPEWIRIDNTTHRRFNIKNLSQFNALVEAVISTTDKQPFSILKWQYDLPAPEGSVTIYKQLNPQFMHYLNSPHMTDQATFLFKAQRIN